MAVTPEALATMIKYHWPGNIRELGNAVIRAVFLSGGGDIRPEHLTLAENTDRADHVSTAESDEESFPTFREAERRYWTEVLVVAGGNVLEMTKVSGVHIKTVYAKIKKFGLKNELYTARKS